MDAQKHLGCRFAMHIHKQASDLVEPFQWLRNREETDKNDPMYVSRIGLQALASDMITANMYNVFGGERFVQTTTSAYKISLEKARDIFKDTICDLTWFAFSWRMTKGIYRFDDELLKSIISTPIQSVPVEILCRLPEWCVYVEYKHVLNGMQHEGFFAQINKNKFSDETYELRLLSITEDMGTVHFGLTFYDKDIGKCFERESSKILAGDASEETKYLLTQCLSNDDETNPEVLSKFISILLYLCSEEPDITHPKKDKPSKPQIIPKLGKMLPASQPIIWDVGIRIGAALKTQREETQDSDGSPKTHSEVRPHIRRAHWHTFTKGKGRTERYVKWIPPIAVKAKIGDDLPAVVHT